MPPSPGAVVPGLAEPDALPISGALPTGISEHDLRRIRRIKDLDTGE